MNKVIYVNNVDEVVLIVFIIKLMIVMVVLDVKLLFDEIILVDIY